MLMIMGKVPMEQLSLTVTKLQTTKKQLQIQKMNQIPRILPVLTKRLGLKQNPKLKPIPGPNQIQNRRKKKYLNIQSP